MGWFYIFIRTFPFWAIPIGIALITTVITAKKLSGKRKSLYLFLSLVLLTGSIYFLYEQGHVKAVPFFHGVFYGP